MRFVRSLVVCLLAVPSLASAQSAGLIISNDDYDVVSNVRRGNRLASVAPALERGGMAITLAEDATASDMRDALVEFGQIAAEAETLFIGLSGRFVHTETETYYLPSDGDTGPLATLSETALPLSVVMAWLADKPGKAVLALVRGTHGAEYGPFVSGGLGELDIPQGVTVLVGAPKAMTSLIETQISRPGRPFIGAAIQNRDINVLGYAARTMVLLDGATPPPATADDRLADLRGWRTAARINTAEAYEDYLADQPDGEFAGMARGRLAALTDTPEARAERTEQALDLNREARRDIQRDLSLLGFNTRGIDGIFGRGTRAAIADWQRRERFEATGYLTREQIALLDEQARRRAEELEAEAEIRREQQRAADLDYWNQTGSRGDEAGLRAYLRRFPDGEFAELAQERLDIYEEQKRERASARDRQLWQNARARNTAAAYERYLVDSPNGAFREEAQARIVALQREAEFSREARAEEAMNLSPGTRRVIEARLNGLGLRPGPVDGVFDEDTRRAIRRYQAARNLPETGYVSDQMMVQLMADTVRQIFR